MNPRPVHLTHQAALDITDLVDFIERHDAAARARHVLDRIEKAVAGLADTPGRGSHPPELIDIGIREYREIFFKPYRIVYRVFEIRVVVVMVSDGRRDMKTLLLRRLLEA